jgi:hypothetical protein
LRARTGFQAAAYAKKTVEHLVGRTPIIVPIRVRGYDHSVGVRKVTNQEVLWQIRALAIRRSIAPDLRTAGLASVSIGLPSTYPKYEKAALHCDDIEGSHVARAVS